MEWAILGGFCGCLLICVALNISILYAMLCGLALFFLYGIRRGHSPKGLIEMAMSGVKTAHNVLINLLLIGAMTALWRACGTIPLIVSLASKLIRPNIFLLTAFLMNSLLSFLTGTAFGTGATMGVICVLMGNALGVDIRLSAGASLSGAFFGDRCSAVSTSALLISELTHTRLYENLRAMAKSALVPFLATCAVYAALGARGTEIGARIDPEAVFRREFTLPMASLAPAAMVLLFSALRLRVKATIGLSILASVAICAAVEGIPPAGIARIAVFGYRAADPEVAAMLNGGGVTSMLRVMAIVCISSTYSGLFRGTGLLDGARGAAKRLAEKRGGYVSTLTISALSAMIACNQTLTILLTRQLCDGLYGAEEGFALDLEDSAVVVAPMVPWSIAGGAPLASMGAPMSAIACACYLYLIPLWRLFRMALEKKGRRGT